MTEEVMRASRATTNDYEIVVVGVSLWLGSVNYAQN